jgi:mRNA interferase HigB
VGVRLIGSNKYRLVVEMQYRAGIACVKLVGTQAKRQRQRQETGQPK